MERLKSTVKEAAHILNVIFLNLEISINLGVSSGRSFPLKELILWGGNLTGLESSGATRSRRRLFVDGAVGRWSSWWVLLARYESLGHFKNSTHHPVQYGIAVEEGFTSRRASGDGKVESQLW
jgi:hypothetical protein